VKTSFAFSTKVFISFIFCLYIHHSSIAQTPSSYFEADKTISCFTHNYFQFTNKSTGYGLTYLWDFGDGTFSNDIHPKKIYTLAGVYNVTLTCIKSGIKYFYAKQITVAPEPEVSYIDIQKTFLGKSYTFISNSTILLGNIVGHHWDFGDAVGSSAINPTHTFKDTGSYDVTLTTTSNYGCTATKTKTFNIDVSDSSVFIPYFENSQNEGCINKPIIFEYTGDTTNTSQLHWDFGDGTTANTHIYSKQFSKIGRFLVKLSIEKNGKTYTNERLIKITNIDASFSYTLSNDSSTVNFAPNHHLPQNQYTWSFGNGCTSTLIAPQHTYFAGLHNVKVVVTNSNGCKDSATTIISIAQVIANAIKASFTVNDSVQCSSTNSFVFNNLSTQGCGIDYEWSFGDGTISTLQSPSKRYLNSGLYTVVLKISFGTTILYTSKTMRVLGNETLWLGTEDSRWDNPNNWLCKNLPDNSKDVIISSQAINMPSLNNIYVSFKDITIQSGASLIASNSTIDIYGNLINKGFWQTENATLKFFGQLPQTINGKVNVGKLIIANVTKVQVETTTPGDSVNIFNTLTLAAGNFVTNNLVCLKSVETSTARLDKVNTGGNVGTLTGNITIETYFQNKRAWRFYTMPFTANGNNANYSISNTLQSQINITGPSGVGFDYNTNYYSMNTWNNATNRWSSVTNTQNTFMVSNASNFSNIPYYVFIRGDKSIEEDFTSSGSLTMKFSGKIQTGNQLFNFSNSRRGNCVFVGNPYPSPVDLAVVQAQSQGLSGNFYYWDPTLNTNGAYVTISNKGNGVWITTPIAAQKGRFLQSCQAMLFEVAASSGQVLFTENAKSDTIYTNTFGSANSKMDMLTINLYKLNNNGIKVLVDGAVSLFGNNYSKSVDENDSKKILNPQDNIGFMSGNEVLSIEARPFITNADSLHIYTDNLNDTSQYAIEILANYTDTTVQQITLVDSTLSSKSNASFNGSTWYYFKKESNTTNKSRFSFIIKSIKDTVNLISDFTVTKQQSNVLLQWKVDGEQNVKNYTVEYSINGVNYMPLTTILPQDNNQSNNYSFVHKIVEKYNKYYYRVVLKTNNDNILLSQVQWVEFAQNSVEEKEWFVYPNPTSNVFNLSLFCNNKQVVQVQIIDPFLGRIVATKYYTLSKGENILTSKISDYTLSKAGLYTISILSEDGTKKSLKLIKVK
jgi:PKD repeat protein